MEWRWGDGFFRRRRSVKERVRRRNFFLEKPLARLAQRTPRISNATLGSALPRPLATLQTSSLGARPALLSTASSSALVGLRVCLLFRFTKQSLEEAGRPAFVCLGGQAGRRRLRQTQPSHPPSRRTALL
ncbi:hypothetical protein K491DRAFT_521985 [Lophiostoma macrostomum CBS 122681]|uniref:Uncharacterized protein n=1 Tax=Lophiostoma macrostomum CBS 122681 TaxID=1314788 RepID=A0A6A6SZQ4_9PLEO|nr:hypothetical protein K491DRAFT_521985 [Lophiostoma macrostomum CBS 122681]